jgi:alginate production protein
LQIGRQNFEEPRQWWWDDDLDAVALRYRGSSLSWEWAVARQVAQLDFLRSRIEPEEEGVWRVLSRASWRYQPGHQFDLFFLHHRDLSSTPGVGASIRASREDESDAQLSWGGLRASGKEPVGGFGLLSYWADLGLVAGRELFLEVDDAPHQRKIVSQRQRHKIFGRAVDVGARWATEFAGRPIFTLSYAVGSGDRRLNRGADHGFRQTGLQSNDEEFRTYGELLRPELANLRIPTVAIAFPFMVKSQIEIAYRNFRQLYAAPFLRDARIDAKPTGKRKNIGNEWMLSALIKEWKNFEIEIVGAAFRAGSAYGTASGTMAYSFFTKLSYEF